MRSLTKKYNELQSKKGFFVYYNSSKNKLNCYLEELHLYKDNNSYSSITNKRDIKKIYISKNKIFIRFKNNVKILLLKSNKKFDFLKIKRIKETTEELKKIRKLEKEKKKKEKQKKIEQIAKIISNLRGHYFKKSDILSEYYDLNEISSFDQNISDHNVFRNPKIQKMLESNINFITN
tara:strand:+ start:51 stop:584 length:534 start_codon:yes stop_codon:yes gene_type:complete